MKKDFTNIKTSLEETTDNKIKEIQATEIKQDHQQKPKQNQEEQQIIKVAAELKSKRLQVLIKPSIYESLKEIAMNYSSENKRLSINELINQILENFIKK